MRRVDFIGLSLADAELQDVRVQRGGVWVQYRDWQERGYTITFLDVLAVQVGPEAFTDLSHGDVVLDDPLLELACREEPEVTQARCFRLFGATADEPVLKVVASSFVEQLEASDHEHTA